MNDQLGLALRKIAEGLYEAADVLFEAADTAHVAEPVLGRPVVSEPELPFDSADYEPLPFTSEQVETTALSRCPAHDRPWTVKAAGVSKAGKPYSAFYKCDGKDPDGSFCKRKPVKAWADAHPIAA